VPDPAILFAGVINGLLAGGIYVLVAVGLTLIYGVLHIINFAHGALFMLGGYAGFVAYQETGNFFIAVAVGALFVGTLLVWAVERQTRVPTEAIIGVVFSTALAIGSMMASGEQLIDALFGAPQAVSTLETLLGAGAALLVIAFMIRARSALILALVSPDLARTAGVDVARLDLLYLLAFAVTVALGLRYLGVLLMGSLIIIPAATARQLARSLNGMQVIAVVIAVFATLAGAVVGPMIGVETGPLTIVVASAVFFVSLATRRAS